MTRGALTGLLCNHILEARGEDEEDGKVVTLISNDISNVENSGEMVHETWGQASEVVLGTFLLARQVGWLWPVPLVFIFCNFEVLPRWYHFYKMLIYRRQSVPG